MKNVILRAAVSLHQSRRARLIGLLILMVVAFLALTTSDSRIVEEVTLPGSPALGVPRVPCDCAPPKPLI